MGIPTVKREKQNYLIDTLHSLLYQLSEEQKKDCVIIIFVAEVSVHGKRQDADKKYGNLCLIVQNTVSLAFVMDFIRAVSASVFICGKKTCYADDLRVKSLITFTNTVLGSDFPSKPYALII